MQDLCMCIVDAGLMDVLVDAGLVDVLVDAGLVDVHCRCRTCGCAL